MLRKLEIYDGIELLSQESNTFDSFMDNATYGLTDAFKFFSSIATLDLKTYLDSKITSGLKRKVYLAYRDKEDISRVEFSTIYSMEIAVPSGMDTPYLPLLDIAKNHLGEYTKSIRKEILDFNKDLDSFISNVSIRKKIAFIGSNKKLDDRNNTVSKLIDKNLSKNNNTVVTISSVVRSFNEYSECLVICNSLSEVSSDKELKYTLKLISDLYIKLKMVTELAEKGEILPQGIRRLEERTTTVANSITMAGKLHVLKFEGDSLIVKLRELMLDAK